MMFLLSILVVQLGGFPVLLLKLLAVLCLKALEAPPKD